MSIDRPSKRRAAAASISPFAPDVVFDPSLFSFSIIASHLGVYSREIGYIESADRCRESDEAADDAIFFFFEFRNCVSGIRRRIELRNEVRSLTIRPLSRSDSERSGRPN